MKNAKRLVVIVDVQNDFVDGALAAEGGREAVERVKELIAREKEKGSVIVYTQDLHGDNYLSTKEGKIIPVPHCIRGSSGADFAEGVYQKCAKVFEKQTFGSRALGSYAAEEGFEEIVFAGICTDICVISNVLLVKAFCPESDIKVIASASAGTTKENHLSALRIMKSCGVAIE